MSYSLSKLSMLNFVTHVTHHENKFSDSVAFMLFREQLPDYTSMFCME